MSTTLVQSLQEHDRYFSRVIDTIPADLYKHTLSEDVDGAQEGKYSKNRKMPLTSEERKTISKAKKTEKYAAVAVAATSPAVAPVESVTENVVEKSNESNDSTGGANLEDLRQRLQARIQGMKNQRTSNKSAGKAAQPAAPKSDNTTATAVSATTSSTTEGASNGKTMSSSEKKNKHKLAAQEREQAKRVRRVGTAINDASDVSIISLGSQDSAPMQQAEMHDDVSVNNSSITSFSNSSRVGLDADLQFSLIAQSTVLGAAAGEGELAAKASKPKGNKLQRLQRLLAEAEKKRARVKQLTAHGGEEGLNRLQGEKWNDALKSAKGERTLVVGSSSIDGSEGKLKAALKKIEKRKQRSADKWADRLAAVEDTERLKIQKREGNINQRRMKMKGIDVPADTGAATTAAPGAAGKDPSGPGSGRKRLYHVLKYGNSDQQEGGGEGKGSGGGGGGGGKKAPGGGGGGGANRAGFEGKKKGYLNK